LKGRVIGPVPEAVREQRRQLIQGPFRIMLQTVAEEIEVEIPHLRVFVGTPSSKPCIWPERQHSYAEHIRDAVEQLIRRRP
jgi:hypothetical protein